MLATCATLLVVALVLVAAAQLPHPTTSSTDLHATWVVGVHAALNGIGPNSSKSDIQTAENALLALHVAAPDREMQLGLALDLVAMGQGRMAAAADLAQRLAAVGK